MISEALSDSAVILVAADPAAWEILLAAAGMLESFGVKWRRASADAAGADFTPGLATAVIVASPEGTLPITWSARTGLPTIRVPVAGGGLTGLELLRPATDGRLPAGPAEGVFATMAIGEAGAKNAALFIVSALATTDQALRDKLGDFRREQTEKVLDEPAPQLLD